MHLPRSWMTTLDEIQKVCPSAVIAGGSLRDMAHMKPVKDLDIFIQAGSIGEAKALNDQLHGVDTDGDEEAIYPATMNEVVMVTDYNSDKNTTGLPVQLIYVNWLTSRICERFDYALCQIMFDGKELRWTDAYIKDKNNKTMTLVRSDNDNALARSVERFARWHEKYPEHKFVLGCSLNMGTGLDLNALP